MAWSYSALDSFELCPKKYYNEKIARKIKEKTNTVQQYGTDAHKAFELRLKEGTPLPLDLRHHEKLLAKLDTAPGDLVTEQRIAINQDFEATGFFDGDVWCRGVIDLLKINQSNVLVVDYKFGKMKTGFDQLELMVALVACLVPEAENFTGAFYWAKDKKLVPKKMTRGDLPDVWNKFLPRVERMELAIKNEEFPARQNFLCKRHCQVTSCPYHGE